MTRGVVRHGALDGSLGRPHFHRGELLAHISRSCAEVCCGVSEFFVVDKEMCVCREHRPTAAGVCDDRSTGVESLDVLTREFACAFEIACVCMQRAATHLFGWCRDGEVVSS